MSELKQLPITIRKRIKIYVDVSLKDDMTFAMGQRLVSFFGQASIFENTEEIIDYMDEFFESLTLNFLTFDVKEELEKDILEGDNLAEQNDLKYIIDKSLNFENNNISLFFLPIVIYFYYTDKRTDFFIFSTFKKKYQINIHKWILATNYLKLKEKKSTFFTNINYFNNMKKYFNIINLLKRFNNLNFVNILSLTNVTYLISENMFFPTWNSYFFSISKKNVKSFFSKIYIYKKLKSCFWLLKSLTSLNLHYILNIVTLKVVYLDEEYEYSNYLDAFMHFISQLYISKRSLFRRLRRRKRFKKKVVRNFFGNKVTYYKIYAFNNNKKKKKK